MAGLHLTFIRGLGCLVNGQVSRDELVVAGGVNGPWTFRTPRWVRDARLTAASGGGGGSGGTHAFLGGRGGGGGASGWWCINSILHLRGGEPVTVEVGAGGGGGNGRAHGAPITTAHAGAQGGDVRVRGLLHSVRLIGGGGGVAATDSLSGAGGDLLQGVGTQMIAGAAGVGSGAGLASGLAVVTGAFMPMLPLSESLGVYALSGWPGHGGGGTGAGGISRPTFGPATAILAPAGGWGAGGMGGVGLLGLAHGEASLVGTGSPSSGSEAGSGSNGFGHDYPVRADATMTFSDLCGWGAGGWGGGGGGAGAGNGGQGAPGIVILQLSD